MKNNRDLIKNIIKGILCMFLFFESYWIQKLIIWIFNIKNITTSTVTILNTISNFVFLLFILFVYRKELIKEWKIFKNKLSENLDVAVKYWLLGLAGMMVSNIIIAIIFHSTNSNNEKLVQEMISSFPFLMLINAGIIGPINEEMLFRKCFKNVFKNKWIFVIASSFIFGLMHVTTATSLGQFLYFIPYSVLGVSFALTYYKTNTVFSSMSMHMLHNTLLIIISIL